jgi:FkbM family methyltransferase
MNEVPKSGIIVNCSTSIYPISVEKKLNKLGILKILKLSDLIFSGMIPLPWFVKEMRDDFESKLNEWEEIYDAMADNQSKDILLNVMKFRLTCDTNFMQSFSVRLKDQYFEDFMDYNNEIFVDAGGFDGDTTAEFCHRYPSYNKIFFFEPSLPNMNAAKLRLKNLKNIQYFPFGLSDKEEQLFFNSEAGSASRITDIGKFKIKLNKLDSMINETITFIKMDLEGWEFKALKGCEDHIKNQKPKLAIAVYHHSYDFRDIFKYIKSLNKNYRVYLRHYTEGWSETVMYFIDK